MKKFLLPIAAVLIFASCSKEEKKPEPAFCWECEIIKQYESTNGMAGNVEKSVNDYCNLTSAQAGKMNGSTTYQEPQNGVLVTITKTTTCKRK